MNCKFCAFFCPTGANENGPFGQCRRRAPLYVADWPVVAVADWCGEFSRIEPQLVPPLHEKGDAS